MSKAHDVAADDLDECECGDYRRDHNDGAGPCRFNRSGFDVCHTDRDCMSFRLARAHRRREMTDEQIKHMAERFLAWRLPETFNPDGGVSFDPIANPGTSYEYRRLPTGTNLLTYTQAVEMVRHMVEGLPGDAQ